MKISFYLDDFRSLLRGFAPSANKIGWRERWRASLGALCGLLCASWFSYLLFGRNGIPLLIAPMGASAVLIFSFPSSPLAQPWPVIVGNSVSALVGIACAQLLPSQPATAALAVGLAILAMFMLRSLHPAGGAIALLAVMGGPSITTLSWYYALAPVALQSLSLVLCAVFFHRLQGTQYPQQATNANNLHRTSDPTISSRLGVADADLDAALARHGKLLDISRADLRELITLSEIQVHQRHHGLIRCRDIMSRHIVTVEFETPLEHGWQLLRTHKIGSLPVLDQAGAVIGVISLIDFLKHAGLDVYHDFDLRLRQVLDQARDISGSSAQVVGHIMSANPITASIDSNILELVTLFSDRGLHSIPVVDNHQKLCGIVTQSDLIAALYKMQMQQMQDIDTAPTP